jgi:hypothetical protein
VRYGLNTLPALFLLHRLASNSDPCCCVCSVIASIVQSASWLHELRGEHKSESSEYGITSFVYRARKPFHPQRLYDLIGAERGSGFLISSTSKHVHPSAATPAPAGAQTAVGPAGAGKSPLSHVVRSKGFFWLATNHTHFGNWASAGRVFQFGTGGTWWAISRKLLFYFVKAWICLLALKLNANACVRALCLFVCLFVCLFACLLVCLFVCCLFLLFCLFVG